MEKTFAVKDHHPDEGKVAVYNTLDERVVHIIFVGKTDWPLREKQEVLGIPIAAKDSFFRKVWSWPEARIINISAALRKKRNLPKKRFSMMELPLNQIFSFQYYCVLSAFLICFGLALWCIWRVMMMIWRNFWEW